jgi:maltose alpha-D-glucosyltransferase/alpha-amylase
LVRKNVQVEDEPLWYKDAIIYQVHVKAFFDANGDGIGDFAGLTEKLDFLEGLGITAIWLLPFYPSPFKDDGYDISDYFNIHSDYGSLKDFQRLLHEAHRRGIRVITELVINHTSDQHPWFLRARRAKPGSPERNFYVWSQTPDQYRDARIIFKDFENSNWTLDPVSNQYYWHRFYHHQPDLNYDNPHVEREVFRVMDYWLHMGVDGMRLDAVPYLHEREGTNCENLPETHQVLKRLRKHVDANHSNRMLLGEANQWPEDAVAYFGNGDECHMAFHFPLMPRMFMAIQMEDRFPILDILDQTPAIPETAQWAIFLRNHDELTLEMVTDEERDYMYRVYARDPKARINLGIRRRLAPLLENDRRKIELMNVLLLSLPGTPVLYYGDEIGMGDNHYLGDRNGVRTPMQWSSDRNAGFSRANPQQLYLPVIIDPEYHSEAVNVENQEKNHASLLWWMKRMISVRKSLKPLGRGGIEFLSPENAKVLAFVRKHENEKVLVVVNLSRHPQTAELDLGKCAGCIPEEVFGQNEFPAIRETGYPLTLGPYGYYLFHLKERPLAAAAARPRALPNAGTVEDWDDLFKGRIKDRFERDILPEYITGCRWFAGKSRRVQKVRIAEWIPVGRGESMTYLVIFEVNYTEGFSETYQLPLGWARGQEAARISDQHPNAVIAGLQIGESEGVVFDGVYSEPFRQNLLTLIAKRQRLKGPGWELVGDPGKGFRKMAKSTGVPMGPAQVLNAEQSNTSILFANGLILKLYRRLEEGVNPDVEIGRYLTEKTAFDHIPPFAGIIEYQRRRAEPMVGGLLQGFLPNEGDGWRYTLDEMDRFLERVLSRRADLETIPEMPSSPLTTAYQAIPLILQELIGAIYLERASLIGRRTAELHLALSRESEDPDFSPEPFSTLYQRSLYQSFQSFARRVFDLLEKNIPHLPEDIRQQAMGLVVREGEVMSQYKVLLDRKITATKIRIHGDYHLGQLLYTGNDFMIIDLEGEPARPLSERRLKRSPLRDVAGMLRSFHYAAYSGLFKHVSRRPEDQKTLEPWVELWHGTVGAVFLRSYLDTSGDAPYLPGKSENLAMLAHVFLLNKAIYELLYELNSRPDWLLIPIKGIQALLDVPKNDSLMMEIERAFPGGLPQP